MNFCFRLELQLSSTVFYTQQTEGKQVYHVGVSTEMTSVPGTLQNMMNAFNHLNEAIRALLVGSEDVAEKVSIIRVIG